MVFIEDTFKPITTSYNFGKGPTSTLPSSTPRFPTSFGSGQPKSGVHLDAKKGSDSMEKPFQPFKKTQRMDDPNIHELRKAKGYASSANRGGHLGMFANQRRLWPL